jgi:hypothetical protein
MAEAVAPLLRSGVIGFKGREYTEDEELGLVQIKNPVGAVFLRQFLRNGKVGEAIDAAGTYHMAIHRMKADDPLFNAMYDAAKQEVVLRRNDQYLELCQNGFKDTTYDGEGNVRNVRVREDPSAWRAYMATIDHNWRNNEKGDNVVNIVVTRPRE